jgi:hypothetical protein
MPGVQVLHLGTAAYYLSGRFRVAHHGRPGLDRRLDVKYSGNQIIKKRQQNTIVRLFELGICPNSVENAFADVV